ncbi:MAG TPA: ATP-binding protein, partial [Acidimicrobiia bacterium]
PVGRTGGAVAIHDTGRAGAEDGSGSVLYASLPQAASPGDLSVTRELTVGDRLWRVTVIEGPPMHTTVAIEGIVWLTGILLTLAFALTAATILRSRDRAARAARDATAELREQAVELRIARDDALAADRLKTTFLATMSHELRTPLNAVIGLSSVLSNEVFGPLTTKQAEYLERITTSGDHLLQLIDDVLSLARIEAGKEDLTLTPMDLAQEVSSAVGLLRAQADTNEITLRIDLPSEPIVVSADRRRLRQILLNLVSNAIKFTPTSREVGVDLRLTEGGAEIAVWDQGIGIPSQDLERIFEPFFQGDSGLSRSNEGTGLGLTLTRRLCEMHGARIRVESSDRGSRFAIDWPTVDQTVPEAPLARNAKHRPPCLAGMRVLLAEDNEANRVLARDLLEYARCDVIEATDGRQALHLATQRKPDLVLLDMQLPEVDGIGVLRALRADPATEHIPVISVTAMVMDEDVERAMNTGCDGLLPKPYTQDEFFSAILSVVGDPVAV